MVTGVTMITTCKAHTPRARGRLPLERASLAHTFWIPPPGGATRSDLPQPHRHRPRRCVRRLGARPSGVPLMVALWHLAARPSSALLFTCPPDPKPSTDRAVCATATRATPSARPRLQARKSQRLASTTSGTTRPTTSSAGCTRTTRLTTRRACCTRSACPATSRACCTRSARATSPVPRRRPLRQPARLADISRSPLPSPESLPPPHLDHHVGIGDNMHLSGNTSSIATSVPNGQFFAPTAGNLAAPPVNSTEGAKLCATPPIHRSLPLMSHLPSSAPALTCTQLQKEPLPLSIVAKPDGVFMSGAARRRMASLARRIGCQCCSLPNRRRRPLAAAAAWLRTSLRTRPH
eukprot:scaffold30701_cov45-Phaeocystis_antarctica.AAC.3